MVKIFRYSLWCVLPFLLSACLEIKEEITVKQDGSGKYRLLLDFSQSRDILQAMFEMEQEGDPQLEGIRDPFLNLDTVFTQGVKELEVIEGVEQASGQVDHQSMRYELQFNFRHLDALNAALAYTGGNTFVQEEGEEEEEVPRYYSILRNGAFHKANVFNLQTVYEAVEPSPEEMTPDAQLEVNSVYQTITYRLVINTDREIKRFSNRRAVLSDDKMRLMMKTNLYEVRQGKLDISNTLRF